MSMEYIDKQISKYSQFLISEVKLNRTESMNVASLVEEEIKAKKSFQRRFRNASPIPIKSRLDELNSFQSWSDFNNFIQNTDPCITRTAVIAQCYICFVYLKDSCFELLIDLNPKFVVTRCAKYLSEGKVRDFRNAFSHVNWHYNKDFSGLICWVREEANNSKSKMRNFVVSQQELSFWQTLSRGVAYATFLALTD
jgi:hypothetical protein